MKTFTCTLGKNLTRIDNLCLIVGERMLTAVIDTRVNRTFGLDSDYHLSKQAANLELLK